MKKYMKWGTAALGAAAAGVAGGAWYAYNEAFRADEKRIADMREIPQEDWAYRERSLKNIDALVDTPFERVSIQSRDGLTLRGKFYAGRREAPLLLFFHGYRSTAERDGSGGFSICREKGWKAMMADQRGHGESEGKTITFGVKERFDVLDWINWAVKRFGEEQDIYLVGISMGAATVLMAAGEGLPPQVKGIWADCGYSSPEAVLRHTIRTRRLPEGQGGSLPALEQGFSAALIPGRQRHWMQSQGSRFRFSSFTDRMTAWYPTKWERSFRRRAEGRWNFSVCREPITV